MSSSKKYEYCLILNNCDSVVETLSDLGCNGFCLDKREMVHSTCIWSDKDFTTSSKPNYNKPSALAVHTLLFTDTEEFIAAVKKYILKQQEVKDMSNKQTITETKTITTIEIKEIVEKKLVEKTKQVKIKKTIPNPELRSDEPFEVGEILECIWQMSSRILDIGDFVKVHSVNRLDIYYYNLTKNFNYTNYTYNCRFKRAKAVETFKPITQQQAIEMVINGKLDEIYVYRVEQEYVSLKHRTDASELLAYECTCFYVNETKYESIPDTIEVEVEEPVTEQEYEVVGKKKIMVIDGKEIDEVSEAGFSNLDFSYIIKF